MGAPHAKFKWTRPTEEVPTQSVAYQRTAFSLQRLGVTSNPVASTSGSAAAFGQTQSPRRDLQRGLPLPNASVAAHLHLSRSPQQAVPTSAGHSEWQKAVQAGIPSGLVLLPRHTARLPSVPVPPARTAAAHAHGPTARGSTPLLAPPQAQTAWPAARPAAAWTPSRPAAHALSSPVQHARQGAPLPVGRAPLLSFPTTTHAPSSLPHAAAAAAAASTATPSAAASAAARLAAASRPFPNSVRPAVAAAGRAHQWVRADPAASAPCPPAASPARLAGPASRPPALPARPATAAAAARVQRLGSTTPRGYVRSRPNKLLRAGTVAAAHRQPPSGVCASPGLRRLAPRPAVRRLSGIPLSSTTAARRPASWNSLGGVSGVVVLYKRQGNVLVRSGVRPACRGANLTWRPATEPTALTAAAAGGAPVGRTSPHAALTAAWRPRRLSGGVASKAGGRPAAHLQLGVRHAGVRKVAAGASAAGVGVRQLVRLNDRMFHVLQRPGGAGRSLRAVDLPPCPAAISPTAGKVLTGRLALAAAMVRARLAQRGGRSMAVEGAVQRSLANARARRGAALIIKQRGYCPDFCRRGVCAEAKGGGCRCVHDPAKVAVCTHWLGGTCTRAGCLLQHQLCPELMPVCSYFLEGICSASDCPYLHVNYSPTAPCCKAFLRGYCPRGAACTERHVTLKMARELKAAAAPGAAGKERKRGAPSSAGSKQLRLGHSGGPRLKRARATSEAELLGGRQLLDSGVGDGLEPLSGGSIGLILHN